MKSVRFVERAVARSYKRRKITNSFVSSLLFLTAPLTLVPLFLVFCYTLQRGFPALDLNFFSALPKPVGEMGGGVAHALVGSLTLVSLATVMGVPLGVTFGLFLSEFKEARSIKFIQFSLDMLSCTPSIVIGLYVYAIFVIPMGHFSAFAGGVALALIMIPTVAKVTEEILNLVPRHVHEAGLALGLPRWKVVLRIILWGNLRGILTGVILGVARISGETAPLLFTAFSNQYWSQGLNQPIASLPLQIYTYAVSPYEDWHRQAWGGALVLIAFVFIVNFFVRFSFNLGSFFSYLKNRPNPDLHAEEK